MRLATPLRLAAALAVLTLAACGGGETDTAADTMMPAGAAGTAGTMPMDTTMRMDSLRADTMGATATPPRTP